jgi:hypothetical protein
MPARVEVIDITCPASQATALEIALPFNPGVPRKVTIIIPDGHSGLTGISLGYGHMPVIPRSKNAYFSGNDEVIPLDLSNYPDGPAWQAFVVNSDLQIHSWEVRFELDEIGSTGIPILAKPLPVAAIYRGG